MLRTKTRLWVCYVLLILNLIFIWGNSMLPGEISGAFSDWVKDLLAPLFGQQPGSPGGGGLLRKLAHFTEFTCLGLCLRWLFGMLRQKPLEYIALPLLCGVAAASIDETIQRFVPLRGPSIKDVGIDTLGIILGIAIISLTQIIKSKKSKIMEENKL